MIMYMFLYLLVQIHSRIALKYNSGNFDDLSDARIGCLGFITARKAWGGDNRKSGAKTGTRRNPVPFDIKELQESPVRPEQAKASPVGLEQARIPAQALSDLNRQGSPVGREQAKHGGCGHGELESQEES